MMSTIQLNETQRFTLYAALVDYEAKLVTIRAGLISQPLAEDSPGIPFIDVQLSGLDNLYLQLYHTRGTINTSDKQGD